MRIFGRKAAEQVRLRVRVGVREFLLYSWEPGPRASVLWLIGPVRRAVPGPRPQTPCCAAPGSARACRRLGLNVLPGGGGPRVSAPLSGLLSPFSRPPSHCHLMGLFAFNISPPLGVKGCLAVVPMHVSLMASDAGHLFPCFLAICASSAKKCLLGGFS